MTLPTNSTEDYIQLYIQKLREATPINNHVNLLRKHWPERYFELCKVHLSYLLDIPCDELPFCLQDAAAHDKPTHVSKPYSLQWSQGSSTPALYHSPHSALMTSSCSDSGFPTIHLDSPVPSVNNDLNISSNHVHNIQTNVQTVPTTSLTHIPNSRMGPPVKTQTKLSKFLSKMFASSNKSPALSNDQSSQASSSKSIRGIALNELIIDKLLILFNHLSKPENLRVKGLFRVSGNHTRVMELRSQILDDDNRVLRIKSSYYNVHDVACAIKSVLRELDQSIFTQELLPFYSQTAHITKGTQIPLSSTEIQLSEAKRLKAVRLLFLILPNLNQRLVKGLFYLLHLVSQEPLNSMSADSLGLLFAPHLMTSKDVSSTELRDNYNVFSSFLAFHITSAPDLFLVPTNLSQEMSRHWVTRVLTWRKSRICNTDNSDEICPGEMNENAESDEEDSPFYHHAAAFVDRSLHVAPKSQEYSSSAARVDSQCPFQRNVQLFVQPPSHAAPTFDTQYAVAEMFAEVQKMPDCPRKRELIQKLNKTNGGFCSHVNVAIAKATAMGGLRSSIRKRIALRQLKHMNCTQSQSTVWKSVRTPATIEEETAYPQTETYSTWEETMPPEPCNSVLVLNPSPNKRRCLSPQSFIPRRMQSPLIPCSPTSRVKCQPQQQSKNVVQSKPGARLMKMRLLDSPIPSHLQSGQCGLMLTPPRSSGSSRNLLQDISPHSMALAH